MDISHLIDSLRSLSKFMYVRTEDELGFLQEVHRLLPKYGERIWVLNASFGGLCLLKDYVVDGTHFSHRTKIPTKETARSKAEFFGAFQEIFRHDPRERENFYIVLDAEVWCSDVVAQRWVLDLADQIELNNDKMVKVFMFVSLTKDPIPEKLAGLFEVVEEIYPLDVYKCVRQMYESLHWGEIPSEKDCRSIFKGMTKYQIDTAILRAFIAMKANISEEIGNRQPKQPAAQVGVVTQAVARLLGFESASIT
jgi:hypothetical protein